MKNEFPNCARCPYNHTDRLCRKENGKSPPFCPTLNKSDLIDGCLDAYNMSDNLEFAKQSSLQEADGYVERERGYEHVKPFKPRIEEIIEFSQKMTYRRLGLAFCIGLRNEAKVVEKLLSGRGFIIISVVCKVGRIPKEQIGVRDDQKISIGNFETMCNPISQASILNEEKTDLNILLGLCVGHDALFFKYAEAPCTVLAVKDRVFGHNPLAAIYTIDSYYRYLK